MKKPKLKTKATRKFAHKRVKRTNLKLGRVPSIPLHEAIAPFNEPFLKHLALMNLFNAGILYAGLSIPGFLDKISKPSAADLKDSERALDDACVDPEFEDSKDIIQ